MKWRSLEESTPGADTRSLDDIFAERKELIAKYVPSEIQARPLPRDQGAKKNTWQKMYWR